MKGFLKNKKNSKYYLNSVKRKKDDQKYSKNRKRERKWMVK